MMINVIDFFAAKQRKAKQLAFNCTIKRGRYKKQPPFQASVTMLSNKAIARFEWFHYFIWSVVNITIIRNSITFN